MKEGETYRFTLHDGSEYQLKVIKAKDDQILTEELQRGGIGPTTLLASDPKRYWIKHSDIYDVRGPGLDDEGGLVDERNSS